jgi:streptogramin lyase
MALSRRHVWATGAGKRLASDPEKVEFKFLKLGRQHHRDPSIRHRAPGRVWSQDEVDLMARVDPATSKVDEFKIP